MALVAVVFMMNTNAQTTASGLVQLEIQPKLSTCTYGTDVNLGATGFSYNAQYMTAAFLNTLGNAAWFCEDTEGDATWALSIEMLSNLVNQSNGVYNIPEANVFVTNPQATDSNGNCTPDTKVNTKASIASAVELFGKTSAITEICTITTDSVAIHVDVPAAQSIGAYSGTVQISYTATLGDGLMTP